MCHSFVFARESHRVTVEICSYHAVNSLRCSVAFTDIFQQLSNPYKILKKRKYYFFSCLNVKLSRIFSEIA